MLKAITSHLFHHEWGFEVVGEFPFGKESCGFKMFEYEGGSNNVRTSFIRFIHSRNSSPIFGKSTQNILHMTLLCFAVFQTCVFCFSKKSVGKSVGDG